MTMTTTKMTMITDCDADRMIQLFQNSTCMTSAFLFSAGAMPLFDPEVTADELLVTLHRVVGVSTTAKPHVADAYFDKNIRVIVLLIEVIAGIIGGACVIYWLWTNKKRRYRVNVIILNVTLTDLLVVCFACGMQLVWELVDREWRAGDALCRLLKWTQSFAMMASNNMLVVLSIDRHNAIRSPLKEPISVGSDLLARAVTKTPNHHHIDHYSS